MATVKTEFQEEKKKPGRKPKAAVENAVLVTADAEAEAVEVEAIEEAIEPEVAAEQSDLDVLLGDEIIPEKVNVKELLSQINDSVDDLSTTKIVSGNASRRASDTIALEEEIACKSMSFGKLVYVSQKTGSKFVWNDIGQTEYIPFAELQTMNNTRPVFLNKPLLIVQDERVINYFNLSSVYENVAGIYQLDQLFKAGNLAVIGTKIDEAVRVNMRDILVAKIRKMRKDSTLTDINIIHLLEQRLNIDFS